MHWRRKWQPTPVFLPGESQDGEAWWAAIYGVAQSWTRLKWLSSSSSSSKEIQPVHPKGNQSWILIGRTDAEAKAAVLGPHDVNSWLTGKDLDLGKVWRQKERRATEDEMDRWHHWFNGHELGQTLGNSGGQRNWHAAVHGVIKSQTQLSDWTTATVCNNSNYTMSYI